MKLRYEKQLLGKDDRMNAEQMNPLLHDKEARAVPLYRQTVHREWVGTIPAAKQQGRQDQQKRQEAR